LFSQSFYSVSAPDEYSLASFFVGFRSSLAVHYFYFTSGRLASYRPTLRKTDVMEFPLPQTHQITFAQLERMSDDQIDQNASEIYSLDETEQILVQDFVDITLKDFKGDSSSPGRQPVWTGDSTKEINEYSACFIDVLQSGFGQNKGISATLYLAKNCTNFPINVVAFHLESSTIQGISVNLFDKKLLLDKLNQLDSVMRGQGSDYGGIYYQRVIKLYQSIPIEIETGKFLNSPTVFIVKPNQRRYWTRSSALRDADEVASDIFLWNKIAAN
jgi:hypothetical protein